MKVQKIVICGFGMALTFLVTVFIVLPLPVGYVNFGDGIILLFASVVNPFAAALIGGIGGMFADIYLGYSQYAIFTLLIKGMEGYIVASLFRKLSNRIQIFAFFIGILIMVCGYYLSDAFLLNDFVAALASLMGNVIQGCVCFVFVCIAYKPFRVISKKQIELFKK